MARLAFIAVRLAFVKVRLAFIKVRLAFVTFRLEFVTVRLASFRRVPLRVRGLLFWAVGLTLSGGLLSPAGWVLARLFFPDAIFFPFQRMTVGQALLNLMGGGLLTGVLVTLAMLVFRPFGRPGMPVAALTVVDVGVWSMRRWACPGVYFVSAAFSVLVGAVCSYMLGASFSGPWSACFVYATFGALGMSLSVVSGVMLRPLLKAVWLADGQDVAAQDGRVP